MHNDCIILLSLLRNAKSYKYIDEIGYYYDGSNKNSTSKSLKNNNNSNEVLHGFFTNIKFLYEKTDNTYLDKYFCIYKVQEYYNLSTIKILIVNYNIKLFKYLNDKELTFITKILNKLINSDYISRKDKLNIIIIKTLILKKVETKED